MIDFKDVGLLGKEKCMCELWCMYVVKDGKAMKWC